MFTFFVISGCTDDKAVRLGPQKWRDMEIVVETRPSPIVEGMNEFIVIASRESYKPGVDLVVTIRVDERVDWRQAIQDGYTGVYRRAIRVNDPQKDILAIHLRKNKKDNEGKEIETVLYFPLNQQKS